MNITGQCLCNSVTWAIEIEPVVQFYCHCHSCQKANSAALVPAALFPADAVSLSGETDSFSVSNKKHSAARYRCSSCGTRVTNIPGGESASGLRGIYPPLCNSTDWFRPSMHIYYEDRSVDIDDDLPKYLDLPEEFGGSGRKI